MPKTMKKLSKEAEDVLIKGLEKASALVNDGLSPTDAIFKVASELSLPAGHVKLMVHGYNNGRTLGQIRNSDSLHEKAADFELADASSILERMFPSEAKTANDLHNETDVAADYDLPPTYWAQRRQQDEKRAAARAFTLPPMTEEKAEYPAYEEKQIRHNLSDRQRCIKAANDAKQQKIAAGYAAVNAMTKLASYFKQFDCIPFSEVRENAVLVKGAAAEKLFASLSTKQLEKQASTMPRIVNWNKEPYNLVANCIKAAQDYTQAKKALEAAEKEATEKSAETLAPFCQAQGPSVITGSVWADQSQTKEAGTLSGIATGSIIGGASKGLVERMGGKPHEQLVQERVKELASPEHEAQLQAIRTQAMLHDLMANDPVISGYDPSQVVDAFNQISQMTPRVAQQRMMAQALLRKYLEQAGTMDMYDQTQILGAEKELARMENVPGLPSKSPAFKSLPQEVQ